WKSSDRPPLQSGFITFARPLMTRLGINMDRSGFTASVLFQLVWIFGLWALLRGLGFDRRLVLAATALTALTGFALIHDIFTWPKMSMAGFVLGAWAVGTDHRVRLPLRVGLACLLWLLAYL